MKGGEGLRSRLAFRNHKDDHHFMAKQTRQDAAANFKGSRLTAVEEVYELVDWKRKKEAAVGETVAAPRLVEQVVTDHTGLPPCVENKGSQTINC